MVIPEVRQTIEARAAALRLTRELGLTARDIATIFECDEKVVAKWLEATNTKQPNGND